MTDELDSYMTCKHENLSIGQVTIGCKDCLSLFVRRENYLIWSSK